MRSCLCLVLGAITALNMMSCQLDPDAADALGNIITSLTEKENTVYNVDGIVARGYDVTTRYAYSPDVKGAVLDFDKLLSEKKVRKDPNLREGEFRTITGETSVDYLQKLDIELGTNAKIGAMGVTASNEFKFQYGQSQYTSNTYSFVNRMSRITLDAYVIEDRDDASKYYEYLSAGFLDDVDNFAADTLDAETFFGRYGTHVIMGAVYGARLDYTAAAEKKTENIDKSVSVSFAAKVEADVEAITVGVGHNESVQTAWANNYKEETLDIKTIARGGAPQYAQSIQDNLDYTAWIDSIEANPVWCDYYPNSLLPVYEFIQDGDKRNKVKAAWDAFLAGKQITIQANNPYRYATTEYNTGGLFDTANAALVSAERIGGGDDNINSGNNRTTNWKLTFDLRYSGTNIIARIKLYAKEVASNYTELEKVWDWTIPVNKQIVSINCATHWESLILPQTGQVNSLIQVWGGHYIECPFLYWNLDEYEHNPSWPNNMKIQFDGSGDDLKNNNNMRVTGLLRIPYTYLD
jgi:hypothetical protein